MRWFPLNGLALLWVAALASLCAVGCNPKIGDDCSTSTDCSSSGDRICDTTQPGGYCTVFNCEPDTCPEEAQCVAFDSKLDPACANSVWPRFERTFCMLRCDSDSDCRSGYVCGDMADPSNAWGASVVDLSPDGRKVCLTPASGVSMGSGLTEVCGPYEETDAGSEAGQDAAADGSVQDAGADVQVLDGATDAGQDVVEVDVVQDVVLVDVASEGGDGG